MAPSSETIFDSATIAAGIVHLSRRDRRLARLLERYRPDPRPRPANLFGNLCRTVCAQLLSNQAAASIFGRLEALCGGSPTPAALQALDDAALLGAGLSRAKVGCLRAITAYWESEASVFRRVEASSDAEVREALVGIKGLGHWSADMFLMFSLGRPDIFSSRDAALANGLVRLKDLAADTTPARLQTIASRWKPYRSVASLALYKWRHANWAEV